MPTAAKDSTGFVLILPTIAVSVIDRMGSATPEINAGIASLLIYFKDVIFRAKAFKISKPLKFSLY